MLTELSRGMHEQFIQHVAQGRKMPVEEVRTLATGAIFSGEQALKLKLVDALGSQNDALELAAKLAELKEKPKLVEPRQKSGLTDRLLQRLVSSQTQLLQKWLYQTAAVQFLPMAVTQ